MASNEHNTTPPESDAEQGTSETVGTPLIISNPDHDANNLKVSYMLIK